MEQQCCKATAGRQGQLLSQRLHHNVQNIQWSIGKKKMFAKEAASTLKAAGEWEHSPLPQQPFWPFQLASPQETAASTSLARPAVCLALADPLPSPASALLPDGEAVTLF